MATTDQYTVVGRLHPTKSGIRLLGGDVDDFLQVDAAAVAMKAWAKGTISAWIMCPDDAGAYTIFCCGDDNVVEFLQFSVETGLLTMRSTDNTTAQFVTQSDNVVIKPHVWHHVAVVQAADGLGVKLYVDGVKVDATHDTSTDLNSWGAELGGLDKGLIGAANKSGDASITVEFKGYISDVKVWGHATSDNAALTADEVAQDYRGETPQVADLVNHWKLKDDTADSGTGADHGVPSGDMISCDANEFASKLTFNTGTPVVADTVKIAMNERLGFGYVIQAA